MKNTHSFKRFIKQNRHYLSVVIFLFILPISCSKESPMMIEEDEMVAIIADLNLSDQIIRRYPAIYRDSIREVLTESLLQVHNLSQAQLDTNLYLYQYDLNRYKRMSEKVVKHLEALKN